MDMNKGLCLFEVETILSVRERGRMPNSPLENLEINLDTLKDRPFDTEPIQMSNKVYYQKKVEDIKQVVMKLEEKAKQMDKQNKVGGSQP